jgi:hypothetical protein
MIHLEEADGNENILREEVIDDVQKEAPVAGGHDQSIHTRDQSIHTRDQLIHTRDQLIYTHDSPQGGRWARECIARGSDR